MWSKRTKISFMSWMVNSRLITHECRRNLLSKFKLKSRKNKIFLVAFVTSFPSKLHILLYHWVVFTRSSGLKGNKSQINCTFLWGLKIEVKVNKKPKKRTEMWMFVCVSYNMSYRNISNIKISDFSC